MNSDNNLNKVYIILISVLNLVAIGLIIRELMVFSENNKIEESVKTNSNLIKEIDLRKFNEIETKYSKIKDKVSAQNTLGKLLEFVEIKTTSNNLIIKDTKVISVNNEEILFDLVIQGSFENIAEFIKEVEEDVSIKEIIKTETSIIGNTPVVKISIRNIIL